MAIRILIAFRNADQLMLIRSALILIMKCQQITELYDDVLFTISVA
jgi:hypothetical protein